MKKTYLIPLLALLFPLVSSAQANFGGIKDLIRAVGEIVQMLTIIAAGAALLVFFWGLVKFILKLGGDGDVEEGKKLMLWGIIALFVMTSVWGLVRFIDINLIGNVSNDVPTIPTFPRP